MLMGSGQLPKESFYSDFENLKADIMCLQEIKANDQHVAEAS